MGAVRGVEKVASSSLKTLLKLTKCEKFVKMTIDLMGNLECANKMYMYTV